MSELFQELTVCSISRVHQSEGSPAQYVTLTTPSGGQLQVESLDYDFRQFLANGTPRYFHLQMDVNPFVRGAGKESKQALRVVGLKAEELAIQVTPLKKSAPAS